MPAAAPACIAALQALLVAAGIEETKEGANEKIIGLRAALVEVGPPVHHLSEDDWYSELFVAVCSELGELVDH